MICNSCFSDNWEPIFSYWGPDKYEKFCGLDVVWRDWRRCVDCGHCQSECDYYPEKLSKVYTEGYRSEPFRGMDINEQFNSIMNLPNHLRENHSRVNWVNLNYRGGGKVLDVGSGLGVFPFEMEELGFKITCTEINKDSRQFIKEELGFECSDGDPGPDYFGKFDLVTIVHVLEHTQAPGLFLNSYAKYLKPNGMIFIEVPDAIEFDYLPKSHDEFNSCHLHFFTVPSLACIVERSGYSVTKIERTHHKARDLSRIRLLGRKL